MIATDKGAEQLYNRGEIKATEFHIDMTLFLGISSLA